jgi:hypothetical protein
VSSTLNIVSEGGKENLLLLHLWGVTPRHVEGVEIKLQVFYSSGAYGNNVIYTLPLIILRKGIQFTAHIRTLQLRGTLRSQLGIKPRSLTTKLFILPTEIYIKYYCTIWLNVLNIHCINSLLISNTSQKGARYLQTWTLISPASYSFMNWFRVKRIWSPFFDFLAFI